MCRILTRRRIEHLSLFLVLWAVGLGVALADTSPRECNANALNVVVVRSTFAAVQNGDTITYTLTVSNAGALPACDITSAEVKVICPGPTGQPNGAVTIVSGAGGDNFLVGGPAITYPGVECVIAVDPGTTTVTGGGAAGDTANSPPSDLTKGRLHDSDSDDPFVVQKFLTNPVCRPAISVNKVCQNASGPGQPIGVTVTVSNTGNSTLQNVSVIDDKVSSLSCTGSGTPNSCGTILAGGTCTCTGSYIPPAGECGPFTDTATASGGPSCACTSTRGICPRISASSSATCTVPFTPSLSVNKTCQDATGPGQPIGVTVTVTNTGNDVLNSVSVTDNKASSPTRTGGGMNSCGTIAVGASCTCRGSYTPPSDQCGPF